jgi:hypothetical protein
MDVRLHVLHLQAAAGSGTYLRGAAAMRVAHPAAMHSPVPARLPVRAVGGTPPPLPQTPRRLPLPRVGKPCPLHWCGPVFGVLGGLAVGGGLVTLLLGQQVSHAGLLLGGEGGQGQDGWASHGRPPRGRGRRARRQAGCGRGGEAVSVAQFDAEAGGDEAGGGLGLGAARRRARRGHGWSPGGPGRPKSPRASRSASTA